MSEKAKRDLTLQLPLSFTSVMLILLPLFKKFTVKHYHLILQSEDHRDENAYF